MDGGHIRAGVWMGSYKDWCVNEGHIRIGV